MSFWQPLIHSGVGFASRSSVKQGVMLSNVISIILCALGIITGILYFIWYGPNVVTFLIPIISLTPGLVIVLNQAGKIVASRTWISMAPPLLLLSLSIYSKITYYDQQEELDYFTFRIVMLGTCVIPLVIFSFKERKALLISLFVGLVLLMLHDPMHTAFGVPYQQDKLKVLNYYFTNIVVFITYLMLVGSLIFLKWLSEKNEDQNHELIQDLNRINGILAERNEEIEAQSIELMAQSDSLNANQNKLLEANRLIEQHRKRLLSQNHSLESELMETNSDLTETNSELIKHNNELRQFSYTVSHNLRGPVASLLGLINLVDKAQLRENNQQIFEYVEASTLQLDQIIKDLNKIIDIRQDIFKVRQKIDLESEVQEIAKVLRRELELHGVTLISRVTECQYIYSIKPMVGSILYNLVSNAIKYRSSERASSVEIHTWEESDFYVIEVCDNGLGIDLKKNRENLFKLYKRFHYHTEGKGLGLYLTKLQCEALGGDIEVESEINRYAKFTVRLQKPANIDRQVLYTEAHAEIFFDAQINATGVIWKDGVTSAQYRNVFMKCLEFVRTYNTPNYITDMTHQGPVASADQAWMFAEIIPLAIQNGLRRIATVRADSSDSLVKEYALGINKSILELGAEQQFFKSIEFAFEWIRAENEKATLQTTP